MKPFEIRMLPWPDNILRTIFIREEYDKMKVIMSPEFESNLNHVLCKALSEREAGILYAYYRDDASLRRVAERFDMSIGWCRQVRDKALRKLRHPTCSKHLKTGLIKVMLPMP